MAKRNTILLLGATGQVGGDLLRLLGDHTDIVAPSRNDADIFKPRAVAEWVERVKPDIVVNAAAYTAVDLAEKERDASRTANAATPEALATSCRTVGARLIHFSTDYVFNGEKSSPYLETDPVDPVNAYGRDKLEGEQAVLAADPRHLVFRLSWVYAARGKNFALTMLRLAKEGKTLRVVADQFGSPTYATDIAEAVVEVIRQVSDEPEAEGGLFHMSSDGITSWHGFASGLLRAVLADEAPSVAPISTSDFPTPARRPNYSKLDNSKLFDRYGIRLERWEVQVDRWSAEVLAGS